MNHGTMFQHVASTGLKTIEIFFLPPTLNPGKREATSTDRKLQVAINKSGSKQIPPKMPETFRLNIRIIPRSTRDDKGPGLCSRLSL